MTTRYANVRNPELWEFGVIAKNLLTTGTYAYFSADVPSAWMPPGYPLLIYVLYASFGVGVAAHVALACILLLFEMLIPLLAGWIATRIWGRLAGIVAFVLALFWPHFLIMSGRLNNVPIYTVLLILAFSVLLVRRFSVGVKGALCGLIIGLYGLFRFEALAFLLPCAYYLVRVPISGSHPFRRKVATLAVLLIIAAVPITPWIIRNYAVFDRFVLSTSGWLNVVRGHHSHATGTIRDPWPAAKKDLTDAESHGGTDFPGQTQLWAQTYTSPADEAEMDALFKRESLNFIKSYPKEEAILFVRKVFYFVVADFTHPADRLLPVWLPTFVALVVGFSFWLRTGVQNLEQRVLWLMYSVQLGLASLLTVVPRYRMAVAFVPLLFFSAWAALWLLPRLTTFRARARKSP